MKPQGSSAHRAVALVVALALALACVPPGRALACEGDGLGPPLPPLEAHANSAWAAPTVSLRVAVVDGAGNPLAARVSITGSDNKGYPTGLDASVMSHRSTGGIYCYPRADDEIRIPTGSTRVTAGRGFEWIADSRYHDITTDTTLTITLTRAVNLAAQGWWPGDLHAHTHHAPIQYDIEPAHVRHIAEAEGLAVIELLDGDLRFTGEPHELSDDSLVMQYSYEQRNQVYGHVSLPALRAPVTDITCGVQEPSWPTLAGLHDEAVPAKGPLLVLTHPHTTSDYALDGPWPGAGLGRGLPLLAAAGRLDALDVVSYSNDPDGAWTEWYDLLGAGFSCGLSAGTDAVLNWWDHPPVGGWRVYANTGAGQPLDHARWLDAIRDGRTFVTNHPLVTRARFSGVEPGGTLDVSADSLDLVVEAGAYEMFNLARIAVIADGREVWARPIRNVWPGTRQWDSTFTVRMATPGWVALRVDGAMGYPHAFLLPSVAHTNVVRVTRNGERMRRPECAARWLGELDQLQVFVDAHGQWAAPWQRDSVKAQVARARAELNRAFVVAPEPFLLVEPRAGGALLGTLRWSRALDRESGDRVLYRVRVSDDSLLTEPTEYWTGDTTLAIPPMPGHESTWWSVEAVDRGGQVRVADDGARVAHPLSWFAGVSPGGTIVRRVLPNPSRGIVRLEGFGPTLEILDVRGRVVAAVGRGIRPAGGAMRWDSRDAAPGVYWARTRDGQKAVRLVNLR
ncbi:MAG: CehA/McbA family metallohydrolase [Candidatus Eisenbacteria bacterium]|nr:CehA/McbA family metallohydrolase [Candidatus Eisenbacteria bacterium]